MQGVNKSPFLLSPSTQKNMKELQTPKNGEPTTTKILQSSNNGEPTISHDQTISFKDFDSACSTPYVSAPSSPGRSPSIAAGCGGFFYSAPTSPMHFLLSASSLTPTSSSIPREDLEEFDFSASWYSTTRPMSSADELFLNGKIRPQKLAPLLGVEESRSEEEECSDDNGGKIVRGRREMKSRNRSLRRIRSMSPLRTTSESFPKNEEKFEDLTAREDDAPPSGSSSRSSSVGRNSKRWVSLKEFLYRSKSEGRNNGRHKYFWSSLSFSPVVKEKDKKTAARPPTAAAISSERGKAPESGDGENVVKREQRSKTTTAARKRRVGLSAHELHYTANRAQAEEMRRKTFLPYRQGLLGCLGFNSKSYGAMNGFARALNPVSSS